MVGSAIKKFAAENGMAINKGVAFGTYHGYMTALEDSMGYKLLSFAVRFEDENALNALLGFLNDPAIKRQYRISEVFAAANSVRITFIDNPGTMKRLVEAANIICDKMVSLGGIGVTHCSSCQEEINGNGVPAVMNGMVFFMHEDCLEKEAEYLTSIHEETKQKGSVLTGSIGALLGALIGAIPWALAYAAGWFVALIGFVIGFLAKKGYELFNGKESRAKGIVILLVTIIGVGVGTFGGVVWGVHQAWSSDPEMAMFGFTLADEISIITEMLAENYNGVLTDLLLDAIMGLLFAFLGIYSTVLSIFKSTSKKTNTLTKLN